MPALDFDSLFRSFKKREVVPAYYFHGDQDVLKDEALRGLLALTLEAATRDFNFDRRSAPDLSGEEFRALALTPPMLAQRRVLVLTEVEALRQRRTRAQSLRAAVTAYLERASSELVLVLVQSAGEEVDQELARRCAAVAFDALPPERVARWVRHRAREEGLELEEEAAAHLCEAVGEDLAQIAAEVAKLSAAVRGRAATVADVADLVGVRRGETVADFVDAVTARRFAEAAGMVTHLLNAPSVTGVRLVSALSTSLLGVGLACAALESGAGPGAARERAFSALQAARPGGLRSWRAEAERWARDARSWTRAEIDSALATLLVADRRLKSASLGDEESIVTEAVLSLGEHAAVPV